MPVIASYSESNQDATYGVDPSENGLEVGQSFEPSQDAQLYSAHFYLKKSGLPTGSAYAVIYAHTGTYGTSSLPTGSALATSDAFDVSAVGATYGLEEFLFSGGERINLTAGVKYVVIFKHANGTFANHVDVGVDESSPSHGGNAIDSDGTSPPGEYYANSGVDVCFYITGEEAPVEPSIVDNISIAESVSVELSDLEVSVVDTVSIAEYVDVFVGSLLNIDVSDSISVAEYVDAIAPPVLNQSVYESVSVSESVTVAIVNTMGTDLVNNPKLPTWSLEAVGNGVGALDEKAPVTECSARGGAILDSTVPTWNCDAEGSSPGILTLSGKAPLTSLVSFGGAVLDTTAPTAECEAESYDNYAELDQYAPTARGEASGYADITANLDKKVPFWKAEITGSGKYAVLDQKAPVWYSVSVKAYSSYGSLDKKAPVAKAVYGSMIGVDLGADLDAIAPVATMLSDTGVGDSEQAISSYVDRLEDYTLEFSGS